MRMSTSIDWSTRLKLGGVLFGLLALEQIPFASVNHDDILLIDDPWTEKDNNNNNGNDNINNNNPKYKMKSNQPIIGMSITFIWFLYFYRKYQHLSLNEKHAPLNIFEKIGFSIGILGFSLRTLSKLYLGKLFTYAITIQKDSNLVNQGPYNIVRHPSYTGIIIHYLGTLCYYQFDWLYILYNLFLTKAISNRIINEENFMLNEKETSNQLQRIKFSNQYRQYKEIVKYRLLPFIW